MDLYINTYGAYLHIKDDMFEIRLPDKENKGQYIKHHIAAHKIRSIQLSNAASISTDAITLALKNNIDILIVDFSGQPIGRFWHCRLGSTTKIRKKQLEASLSDFGLFWIKKCLIQKLENQTLFLKSLSIHRPAKKQIIEEAITNIKLFAGKIESKQDRSVDPVAESLRGFEGSAGRSYFKTLSALLPENLTFKGRSSRPAKDPFNACLNYCYGILYSKIEKALIIAGIDPYVGFLHRDNYNQKSMVFDFIEPFRPYADEVAFKFFSKKIYRDSYFENITNGVKLNDEGKPALIEQYSHYFDKTKYRYKNKNVSRHNMIQLEAHQFANQLLKL